jgi:hypothetical protein
MLTKTKKDIGKDEGKARFIRRRIDVSEREHRIGDNRPEFAYANRGGGTNEHNPESVVFNNSNFVNIQVLQKFNESKNN